MAAAAPPPPLALFSPRPVNHFGHAPLAFGPDGLEFSLVRSLSLRVFRPQGIELRLNEFSQFDPLLASAFGGPSSFAVDGIELLPIPLVRLLFDEVETGGRKTVFHTTPGIRVSDIHRVDEA